MHGEIVMNFGGRRSRTRLNGQPIYLVPRVAPNAGREPFDYVHSLRSGAGSGPPALCFGMWASRRCGRTRQMNKANGPEHPGPSRTWCSSLSTSVLAVVETMSSYLRRLSLRFLLTQISPTTNGENGPGGIRTHIRALTESCAAVAPRAL
jgi:hypothetical protein